MKSEFSESTFAFSLTQELLQKMSDRGIPFLVPLFPSLQKEEDLGFDVEIKHRFGIVYLQFKVSEYLVFRNASESRAVTVPYYRFAVKTRATSRGAVQHNTLVDLEKKIAGTSSRVYYCAPIFHTEAMLQKFFTNDEVVDNSVFPKPSLLGRVRTPGERHVYTMSCRDDVRAFSEPKGPRSGGIDVIASEIREALLSSGPTSLSDILGIHERIFADIGFIDDEIAGRGGRLDTAEGELLQLGRSPMETPYLPPLLDIVSTGDMSEEDGRSPGVASAMRELGVLGEWPPALTRVHRLSRIAKRAGLVPLLAVAPDPKVAR